MNKTDQPSYEEALERLKQLTETLEQGNLDLEATVKAFEEGKELVKYCEGLLGKAEEVLAVISFDDQTPDGSQIEPVQEDDK